MFIQSRLKNRMRIIISPHEGTEAFTALVFVPVGSRYEPDRIAGVSHFLEHMMFKGTKKRPKAKIIARALDAIGASYNAYTGKEYTGYYIKADARHTELAMDILSDIYYHSIFAKEEIEREKGAVIQEIHMYEDNPLMSIEDWFEQAVFGKHTLGRNIAGSVNTVSGLTRENVAGWHETFYRPSATVISIAGKMEPGIDKLITKYFDVRERFRQRKIKYVPFKHPRSAIDKKVFLKEKKTDQLQAMLGFPSIHYDHKDEPAVTMLQTILGAGMSSRLFTEVRERRGLAYLVRAGSSEFKDAGVFYVHAGLDPSKLNQALTVIMNELRKIKSEKVGAKELNDAKEQWRGRMVLSWEDSSTRAEWYARSTMFYRKVTDPDQEWKKIMRVTREDIGRVAKNIIKFNKMKLAVIGSPKEKICIS